MDIDDIIRRLARHTSEDDCVEKKVRREFERRFEDLELDNWILCFEERKTESGTEYGRSSKYTTKWECQGLTKWAAFAAMHGHPIVRRYKGVEDYLSDLGPKWCCVIEKDDELIILSNFKTRSAVVAGI